MATVTTIRIPTPTDKRVLDLFTIAAQSVPSSTFEVRIPGANLGSFPDTKTFTSQNEGKWQSSKILDSITLTFRGSGNSWVNLTFRRPITTASGQRESSMWENELNVDISDHEQPDASLILKALHFADEFRKETTGKLAEDSGSINLTRDVFAAQITQLTELHSRIVEEAEASRLKQDLLISTRKHEIETEYSERISAISEIKTAAEIKIKAEEDRLAALSSQLDDRGHMHARRQLRTDITAALKTRLERPGVSKQTATIRLAVVAGSLFGCVVFGSVAAISMTDLHNVYSASNPNIYVLGFASLRFALPAAAAAGLLFYALGWLRRLHAEDVHAERSLERYRYDLDRASWAIETILEAQGKEGGTVPPEWIAGVTHGLFVQNAGSNEDRDAADALGSLLNFAAKAEFGPGGPKLEFQKRDLRRLSREAAESS